MKTEDVRFLPDWWRCMRGADLKLADIAVAYMLMSYADNDGSSAHPGNERLMADTGASESTVKRALKALVESGWIRVVSPGGRSGACEYQLTIPLNALGKLTDKRLAEYNYHRVTPLQTRVPSPDPW